MKITSVYIFLLFVALSAQGQNKAGLTISLPYLNNYHFYHYEINKDSSKSGFAGLGLAFFYKTEKNKFSINSGITSDVFAPIGPIDYGHEGTRISVGAMFLELLFHRNIYRKLKIITGINFNKYRYSFIDNDSTLSYNKFDKTIGLTSGLEYVFKKNFSLSLLYKPAIVSFNTKGYKHLLTLDFRFDINIWKKP